MTDQIDQRRCITLVGPRQSGKTTLCKEIFPRYRYYSFESPDTREQFLYDPRSFLGQIESNAIFDEVQKVPDLLSYLQEVLDDAGDTRKFILTGSNNLMLTDKVAQSLAGRTKILTLLPLERSELPERLRFDNPDRMLFYGGYPRIYNENLDPRDWLGDYIQTYVEKDIRETIRITDLRSFETFLRLLAGRTGQLVNFNSLAGECGISQPTAKKWTSALESTYTCFLLQPHFRNFNKRIIKAPKVYFHDTGLLCYLLRIRNPEQLQVHPLRGSVFENWVISEIIKGYYNQGSEAPVYFWRDQHGHEIDLILDEGMQLDCIEIKSSATFHKDFFKNIDWLNRLQGTDKGTCIYGGMENLAFGNRKVVSWSRLSESFPVC